jgi:hypothetical protein
MTEAEAKTKWCPFARVGVGAGAGMAGVNRPIYRNETVINATGCIGSDCMAWREAPAPAEIVGPIHGFCGLAGASQ